MGRIVLSEERNAGFRKLKAELDKFWSEVDAVLEKPVGGGGGGDPTLESKSILQHIAKCKISLKHDPQVKNWFDIEPRVSVICPKMIAFLLLL